MGARTGGSMDGELVSRGDRVSFWEDGPVLGMDGGDGCECT